MTVVIKVLAIVLGHIYNIHAEKESHRFYFFSKLIAFFVKIEIAIFDFCSSTHLCISSFILIVINIVQHSMSR